MGRHVFKSFVSRYYTIKVCYSLGQNKQKKSMPENPKVHYWFISRVMYRLSIGRMFYEIFFLFFCKIDFYLRKWILSYCRSSFGWGCFSSRA